ncbi:hypothetical protein CAPGI0001_1149 [Capnocytophaga gingivalis ATCC 33624]|nr:hypothetical protein CAPGI0001_1149 [Capnocytophaga gingivalis ATCC 33624]
MQFAHIANYPHFKFVPIPNLPPFQIRHVTIHPHSQSPPCYNLPPFQIRPYCKLPYAVVCVFSSNRPYFKFTPIANRPCFQLPPCGRANCNSPLHVCYQDVRKHTCKYKKKHHGHGVSTFACVVGANCNSPILQFAPISNSPMFSIAPIPNLPWDKKLEKKFFIIKINLYLCPLERSICLVIHTADCTQSLG